MKCVDSILDRKEWGSVRKTRFRSQIASLVYYALRNDGLPLVKQDIKNIIVEDRAKRETVRMRITQTGRRRALEQYGDELGKAYSALVNDTIAFARGLGIFSTLNGCVKCLNGAKEFSNYVDIQPKEFENRLLRLVLNSKYKAYLCFLANLQRQGGQLHIPPKYRERNATSGIREFLHTNHFATDVPSFFAIRDLLYDFGVINWRILPRDSTQEIYLTSELAEKGSKPRVSYAEEVELDECSLFFSRVITSNVFAASLEKQYLSLSQNDFAVIVDLLELRDLVCQELKLSDNQFNKMLLTISRDTQSNLEVELSQGRIPLRKFSGLLIKAVNVIEIDDETFATYVRLRRKSG